MKIVVLAGGLSPERNVSLSTGTMVTEALRTLGHHAALVDMFFGTETTDPLADLFDAPISAGGKRVERTAPDLDEVRRTRKGDDRSLFGPKVLDLCAMADLVFLALHGSCGEDGRVQAAFDLMGIPYTGAGYLGSAIAMDKDLTKRLVADIVKTPAWRTATYIAAEIEELTETTPLPCVVKPVASGSSIGVSIVHDRDALRKALTEGLALGGRTVLEQYVCGRELQV
ncbi:MAG: D-alanine--D-alanine ligase, partial [Pseudoflavonifractor sp.]